MPFAPAANPDLAGEFMSRGILTAGAALGGAAQAVTEGLLTKSKERKAYLGLADAMVKGGELSETEAAALQNMDTDRLKGFIDGKKVALTLKRIGLETQ